ncbi:MAG: hypothetical protein RDU76_11425 [Candidatus Edwardsbacteria bacterium]|nr:hypothetical protein [Candidatus Edwardsbacteria bacterium]
MELKELMGIAHEKYTKAGLFNTPGRFSKQLGSLHENVSEALVEYSEWGSVITISHSLKPSNHGQPLGVPIALASAVMKVLALCAEYKIDLEAAVKEMAAYECAQRALPQSFAEAVRETAGAK